ncbi:hypothetical protein [Promicromonospora sp. NPDC057488]|uniref:hypothetical protein n=1 Tax=Promicromonospora sp. NPDC057488 TaxID=3346147 RepID=UPI00366B5BFD
MYRTTTMRVLAIGAALGLFALAPQTSALAGTGDDHPAVTTQAAKAAIAHETDASVSCNDTEGDDDSSSWAATAKEPANMRSGPSTACAKLGVLQTRDKADYHCYKPGKGGTWTYLRDDRTGAKGWVKDSLLEDRGSAIRC